MVTAAAKEWINTPAMSDAPDEPVFVRESIFVALVFGASCWLLDAFLTQALAGLSLKQALLPTGEALALRTAVALLVTVASAITSSFLIREIRMRREAVCEPPESLHDVLESFSACAFAVSTSGEIIDANDAAGRLFEWPVNMFMPMKIDWLISEFIDEPYAELETFAELVASGACCNAAESVTIIAKALTGHKFVADLTCMPARDERQRLIVFVRERVESQQPVRQPVDESAIA